MKRKWSLLIIAALISGCAGNRKIGRAPASLKEAFKNDFLIGTALSAGQIGERDAGARVLVPQQFNAITPENVMKCEAIHPQWNRYDYKLADEYVNYGSRRQMFIVGHTLIWHSQLPGFVHRIKSPDSLRLFMQQHIHTIASRYAGRVNSWDVVNEALNEDGTLRRSVFFEKLGPSYIAEAFKLAAEAAPGTLLYYNDYNIEQPAKRRGAIELIRKIQASGARIDGVGIQGHWHLGQVPFRDLEQSIADFSALGIKVAITELDINVLPRPKNMSGAEVSQKFASDPEMNPYPNGLPAALEEQLAKDYEQLFKILVKYKQQISRVTFWGVHDGQSWLNNWPIPGRTNYPLLFDRQGRPKPAYYRVLAVGEK
ncbi:endo-1,4-beta-xylanase [Niabella sp. CC-SYL272]|uniref:endo-1,4-beta-xylanase n=1 Tax=Niabella agricola TaxID=2891571 RepID=UPI001F38EB36|nr:endo-1,4-beta-xylanase [Niabella agricola]MCF3107731.1 endo-1,4-beta-xylanase [Niabella agricola]